MDRIRACGACDRGSTPLEGTYTKRYTPVYLFVYIESLRGVEGGLIVFTIKDGATTGGEAGVE